MQQQAPDFKAQAVVPDGSFKQVSLADYRGKYVILFFYPLDFTFVCPTEIIAFSDKTADFEKLGVQLLACSIDSHCTHLAWRNTPRTAGGSATSPSRCGRSRQGHRQSLRRAAAGIALRGLFLIDKTGVVRHQVVNDLPLGRNIDEALRMVQALQYFEKNGEVCPANWKEGELSMKADPQGSKTFFEKRCAGK